MKKEKEKKKKHRLTESLYISFMPLAVQCQWSLCGLKGVVGCVPTTGHAQKLWGGRGHAQVMHAMWVQAVVIKTSQWCSSLIFWPGKRGGAQGWCLGAY